MFRKISGQKVFYLFACMCAFFATALAPVRGIAQVRSPSSAAELRNLGAQFLYHQEQYERFESNAMEEQRTKFAPNARLVQAILLAHERGQFRHVIELSEGGQLLSDGTHLRNEGIFVLMALSSAYFHERSFRSSAEICNLLAEPIQRWSSSEQVRKFASQCAFSVLKSVAVWGRRVDIVRDFGAFLMHPGFASSRWQGTLASNLVAAIRAVGGDSGQSAQSGHYSDQPLLWNGQGTPNQAVTFLGAVVAIEGNQLEKGLSLLESAKIGPDEAHAAMAHWLSARIQSDLGRAHLAANTHEAATELLTEQLRRAAFKQMPNQIEIALFARMIFDSVSALKTVGSSDRAQVVLTNLGAIAAELRKSRPEMLWLEALEDAAWIERARIASQLQSVPSQVTLASAKSIFARTLGALDELASRFLPGQRNVVRKAFGDDEGAGVDGAAIENTALRLGLRSRSLDAIVVGRARLAQADNDLDALNATQTRLLLQSAGRDPSRHDSLIWLNASDWYFISFLAQAAQLLKDIQVAAGETGKDDVTWNFIRMALGLSMSGSELSFRQNQDFNNLMSPFSDLKSNPVARSTAALPGRVSLAGRQGQQTPAVIHKLALQGHYAFSEGAVLGRSEKLLANREAMLQRAVDLIETGMKRSKKDTPDRYESYLERGIACLTGMRDAFALMHRVVRFERLRSDLWNRNMVAADSSLNVSLEEARKQRAELAATLRQIGRIDSSAVVAELRALLSSRQNSLKEAMLLAFSAGVIASDKIESDLQDIDKQITATSRALDEAAAAGSLR
jgi:hypothetical protein